MKHLADWSALAATSVFAASMWVAQGARPAPDRAAQAQVHAGIEHSFPPAPAVFAARRMMAETPITSSPSDAALPAGPEASDDAPQVAFEEAHDLFGHMMRLLPQAARGDGASAYYLYMALEECRVYLGLDAAAARAIFERGRDWPAGDDGADWEHEYFRCRNFAQADFTALRAAMGDDVPGAITEYGAVWFERAVHADYPPAVAEMSLRPAG